ncbi:MFS transporter [Novosphingobium panipatense]|uniref:Predicted arabinose efflux permease, MFS family n=1 Tax=Novosphingobium panipatense TaxID=428991 RepID=A0ABY1QQP0_9SPHN|nr:MFS transporter [Novosphingobium panipatense]SMP77828.1 Predicted arabinose efflux permease, MFS family [Novosphingobium panipatense]
MLEENLTAREEFGRHWRMVVAAAVGFSFTSVVTASTGLFIGPISREFGWSITLAASGVSITAVLTFLFSPLFGLFIDKWGVRRMALPGLLLMGLVIASLSLLDGSVWQWFAIWTFYSLAALMTKSTVWTASANSTFRAGRGIALGLVLSGSALAQAFTPVIAEYLIRQYGWRLAFVYLAAGWGILAVTVCFSWLRDGYEIGREAGQTRGGPLLDVPGLTVREALRNGAVLRVAASTFLVMMVTIGLVVHQFRILTGSGFSPQTAALASVPAGLAGIAGKLITGALLDRYPARWVGGLTIGVSAVTFAALLIPHAPVWMVVGALVVNGYASGTKLQLVGYLTAAYTGMRQFGAIFGLMASLIAAGSGLGPVLGGWIYDTWQNYDVGLWAGLLLTLISSWLLLRLPAYPDWSERRGAQG